MRDQMWLSACALSSTLTVVLLISAVGAIEVTPNSPCSPLCLNNIQSNPADDKSSFTIATNVPCDDWEIVGPNTTVRGRQWVDCLSCEKTSDAIDIGTQQNDVYWLLFNFKFTLDWCVFGYPNRPDIPPANAKCAKVCAGPDDSAKRAMTDRLLQTNQTLQYLYCDGPDIESILDDCAACLDTVPNAKALGHYAEGMKQGCVQRPDVGKTLEIDFDLFPSSAAPPAASSTPLAPAQTEHETEIVTLTPSATLLPPSATLSPPSATLSPPSAAAILASSVAALAASSSSSAAAVAKSSHDQNVRVGVGVGLGVGAALVIAAVVGLILARRRSARKKQDAEEEARARWEGGFQASMQQKQTRDRPPQELGGDASGVVEADDGRPSDVPMLEGRAMSTASPGVVSSSGERSWASTPRGSRASRSGVSRMLGMKPAVPAK